MPKPEDIDHIIGNWEYEPGTLATRLLEAEDGREVIQVRVDLGLLQLETEGRPDGTRPGGAETYYDYLLALAIREGDGFELDEEQLAEVERELLQYYQRRVCWLSLQRFDLAVQDADHNLSLLDFAGRCTTDEEWVEAHEQYRPFILFHRTEAAALSALEGEAGNPRRAINELNQGLERMREVFRHHDAEEVFDDNEMVRRLCQLRDSLREDHELEKTLEEQLAEAVANEEYELAARLRDEIAREGAGG